VRLLLTHRARRMVTTLLRERMELRPCAQFVFTRRLLIQATRWRHLVPMARVESFLMAMARRLPPAMSHQPAALSYRSQTSPPLMALRFPAPADSQLFSMEPRPPRRMRPP